MLLHLTHIAEQHCSNLSVRIQHFTATHPTFRNRSYKQRGCFVFWLHQLVILLLNRLTKLRSRRLPLWRRWLPRCKRLRRGLQRKSRLLKNIWISFLAPGAIAWYRQQAMTAIRQQAMGRIIHDRLIMSMNCLFNRLRYTHLLLCFKHDAGKRCI